MLEEELIKTLKKVITILELYDAKSIVTDELKHTVFDSERDPQYNTPWHQSH